MKKTSTIVKGTDTYEMTILINNIALVNSKDGTTGLLDIRSNKILGRMRKYHTIYDESRKFYTQTWSDDSEEETNDRKKTSYIRIYDVKNEEMMVDDGELIESFRDRLEVCSIRSKKDKKLHLFDIYNCRHGDSILKIGVDSIVKLLDRYNDSYYVLKKDGKCALYFSNCYDKRPMLLTDFDYDNIESSVNVLIFTRNGKKHFRFYGDEQNKSIEFDEIRIEEKNKNILYGIKGSSIYVYNTETKELILQTEAENIEYLGKDGDSSNEFYGEYYFRITKKGKFGLLSSDLYKDRDNKRIINQTTILNAEYDEIERGKYSNAFYLGKNGKYGLLVGNGNKHQLVTPKYDDINNMKGDHFEFVNNGHSDIVKVVYYEPPKTIIEDVEKYESVDDGYIITKKGKKGMLIIDSRKGNKLISPEYDDITVEGVYYYITSKDNKKGVISKGEVLIPAEYDDIRLGGEYSNYQSLKDAKKIYFALKKDNRYELAKIDNYHYVDCEIEYVSNHKFKSIDFYRQIMVFKDDMYTYVYSYEEKMLKSLPGDVEIREVAKEINSYDKKYVYYIDGKYYIYKDGKFTEEHVEEKDVFVTTYESDTDIYEIRTINQREHDAFCSMIDEKSDEEAETLLQDYSKNKQKVKSKYPTVDLNRRSKNEE